MIAKLFSMLFLLSVAFLVGAGCSSKSTSTPGGEQDGSPGTGLSAKLVGTWETEPERVKANGKEVGDPITMAFHFKADGGFQVEGFFPIAGTWKTVKEEGNTLTVQTEVGMPDFKFESKEQDGKKTEKSEEKLVKEKKTFTITFDGADAITMTNVGEKPQPMKLKRKR